MTVQDEGGGQIEWNLRVPDIISNGEWEDDGYWNDDGAWSGDVMWTTIASGDRMDD